jgi:protein-disulfide isomerase
MFELFGSAGAYSRDGILAAGGDAGVDLDAFEACVDEGRYDGALQRNLTTAVNAGLRVTPTFFINGQKVEGNLPLASFEQQLDSALGS